MEKENITYQLVPPHNHRANAAERAIQTFTSHFKSILATADPDFPLAQWDLLLPQTNLTLNLLCASRRVIQNFLPMHISLEISTSPPPL